jgi:SAM-dependent methyltransferase
MELRRALTIWRQRQVWSSRAAGWDAGPPPGLERVVAAVLERAAARETDVVVDLGCGTGQLSLPLAQQAARVLAVDVSPLMIERLDANASHEGLGNVEGQVAAIEHLDLPPASIDLVVSNYALHHLRDRDKELVIARIAQWLRPGGSLVIGDMMFGRGGEARDRAIIASKVSVLIRRGPAGWWRVAKNGFRFLLRVQERPVSIGQWESMLRAAGFEGVASSTIVEEAAIVSGRLRDPAGTTERPSS